METASPGKDMLLHYGFLFVFMLVKNGGEMRSVKR